jgi:peptide-methionine (S)-S-oxide reductase
MNSIFKTLVFIISISIVSYSYADKAVFAGGCFWCVEAAYQDVDGVTAAVSGFTGGSLQNPTYRGNHKGHYEAVEITYDPAIISYQELLDIFWINIDPFDDRGQFCDKGFSYLSAIFAVDESQQQLATASRAKVVAQFSDKKVVTPILTGNKFWPVEEYHQDYYLKNPLRYKYYRYGCGRDARLQDIWGDRSAH